jgi:RHS repeat-associated protein
MELGHNSSLEQVTEMGVGDASSANSASPASSSNSALTWQHTNVYAGGKLLGTYDSGCASNIAGLHFYFDDPLPGSPATRGPRRATFARWGEATGLRRWGGLGTRRAQTDYAGVLEQSCVSLPFGDALSCAAQPGTTYSASLIAPTEQHFTGKERDAESGNDYFGARYYSSAMGRWMSPDWSAKVAPVPYAKLDNPQSLNLYAYVLNNPLIHIDADGHIIDDSALKDNKKYQAWKKDYLSHSGAAAQWNALNDNKSLTVTMKWDSKGTQSVTGGFQFNDKGQLTAATVTLAARTGDSNYHMSAASGYVHGSTITDSKLQGAYVVAHELAHVEQAEAPGGKELIDQRHADGEFTQQKYSEMGIQKALQDPAVAAANQRLMDTSQQLETGADQRAWDIVGQK